MSRIAWSRVILFGGLILGATAVEATEVYVLRFRTDIIYSDPARCLSTGWRDDLLFHNATQTEKAIRLLSTTPGTVLRTGTITVAAGRTASTLTDAGIGLGGEPFGYGLTVNKLDVPEGVVVSSRADVYGPPIGCGGPPPGLNYSYGNLPLPIFRSLAIPNARQIHLPIDLGIQPRRTNVIVYNAGAATATALIELRSGCDDSLISERALAIPPNSVIQATGLTDTPERSCAAANTTPFTRYVVVTVDQPSLSHTTTISAEFPTPTIGATVSAR
jgi:hypothetical protein